MPSPVEFLFTFLPLFLIFLLAFLRVLCLSFGERKKLIAHSVWKKMGARVVQPQKTGTSSERVFQEREASFEEILSLARKMEKVFIYINGGVASGKSLLARKLSRELGIKLVQVDEVIRENWEEWPVGITSIASKGDAALAEWHRKLLSLLTQKLSGRGVVMEGILSPSVREKLFRIEKPSFVIYVRHSKPENLNEALLERAEKDLQENTTTLGYIWFQPEVPEVVKGWKKKGLRSQQLQSYFQKVTEFEWEKEALRKERFQSSLTGVDVPFLIWTNPWK